MLIAIPQTCGSEPARESGVSVDNGFGCADAFASKLAPTGCAVVLRFLLLACALLLSACASQAPLPEHTPKKSAAGYLEMIRQQGFEFGPQNVSYPYLWWSRARDFGLLERFGLRKPKPFGQREETLVNVVARKPLEGTV